MKFVKVKTSSKNLKQSPKEKKSQLLAEVLEKEESDGEGLKVELPDVIKVEELLTKMHLDKYEEQIDEQNEEIEELKDSDGYTCFTSGRSRGERHLEKKKKCKCERRKRRSSL